MLTLCATAFVILVAGYDTTGMTLGYVAYVLATHQDIQGCNSIDIKGAKLGTKLGQVQ